MPDSSREETEDAKHRRLDRGCLFAIIGLVILIWAIAACIGLFLWELRDMDAALDDLPAK